LAIASLPQFDPARRSPPEYNSVLTAVNVRLPDTIQTPAIVLFRFTDIDNVHDEPVYNVETANPDNAKIIRAHDLGPRNIELFNYYATRQPNRHVSVFDPPAGPTTY